MSVPLWCAAARSATSACVCSLRDALANSATRSGLTTPSLYTCGVAATFLRAKLCLRTEIARRGSDEEVGILAAEPLRVPGLVDRVLGIGVINLVDVAD